MPVRVYIEDTDAGGIVYYANYLKYMERARTEWLRACGIELDDWQRTERRLFVVRQVNIDYRAPALFNELLTVDASLENLKRASLELIQTVHRDDKLLVSAEVRLACCDADTLTPVAIPAPIEVAISSWRATREH